MLTTTAILLALSLGAALWLRPWRLLRGGALLSPLLASLAVLPWLWALPWVDTIPLAMHWSFAWCF
jgi:hypothetical protein